MIRMPFREEWDTSHLSNDRRAHLSSGLIFEDIATQILASAHITHVAVKPFSQPAKGEPRSARQVIFRVSVDVQTSDLLYNSPDGLRGRYWQSPDHGFAATTYLIGKLLPDLLFYAEHNPPVIMANATPMTSVDIKTSLESPSAKIWPREQDDDGNSLLNADSLMV